jgi:hypothetical protein
MPSCLIKISIFLTNCMRRSLLFNTITKSTNGSINGIEMIFMCAISGLNHVVGNNKFLI